MHALTYLFPPWQSSGIGRLFSAGGVGVGRTLHVGSVGCAVRADGADSLGTVG